MRDIDTILETTIIDGYNKKQKVQLIHSLFEGKINLWLVKINKELIWTCDSLEAARKNYENTIHKIDYGFAA